MILLPNRELMQVLSALVADNSLRKKTKQGWDRLGFQNGTRVGRAKRGSMPVISYATFQLPGCFISLTACYGTLPLGAVLDFSLRKSTE